MVWSYVAGALVPGVAVAVAVAVGVAVGVAIGLVWPVGNGESALYRMRQVAIGRMPSLVVIKYVDLKTIMRGIPLSLYIPGEVLDLGCPPSSHP